MLLNTIAGIREVPVILGRAAASLGASRRQILFTVVLPAAVPFLFTGLRLSFGSAWITIVAAELIAASSGLGYLIMNARRILAAPDIVVGMLTIGIIGLHLRSCVSARWRNVSTRAPPEGFPAPRRRGWGRRSRGRS